LYQKDIRWKNVLSVKLIFEST